MATVTPGPSDITLLHLRDTLRKLEAQLDEAAGKYQDYLGMGMTY